MHHCSIVLKQCPKCSLAFVPSPGPFCLSAGRMLYCPKKHAALCQNTIFSLSKLETCAHLSFHLSSLCFICSLCPRLSSYILALLSISLVFLSIGYHLPTLNYIPKTVLNPQTIMYWPLFFYLYTSRHLEGISLLCISLLKTRSSSPLEEIPPRSTVVNSMVPASQVTLAVGGHCFCLQKLYLVSSTSESTSSPLPLSAWLSFPPLTIWLHTPFSPVAALLI